MSTQDEVRAALMDAGMFWPGRDACGSVGNMSATVRAEIRPGFAFKHLFSYVVRLPMHTRGAEDFPA